jgi:hypothetical protein
MGTSDPFNITTLRSYEVPSIVKRARPPHHAAGERFLKGPIPLDWLTAATRLPGKAVTTALSIWFLVGLKKMDTVQVTNSTLAKFSVGRKAGYSGLAALENAGLISVKRHRGRSPVVTVLDYGTRRHRPAQEDGGQNTLGAS